MNIKKNPFPKQAPTFIRMKLYHYHFTGSTNKIVVDNELNWWSREFVREYLPALSLKQEEEIKRILNRVGVITTSPKKLKNTNLMLKKCLDIIRAQALLIEPHILVWSVSLSLLPIMFSI